MNLEEKSIVFKPAFFSAHDCWSTHDMTRGCICIHPIRTTASSMIMTYENANHLAKYDANQHFS
jgi:hypothetical protein